MGVDHARILDTMIGVEIVLVINQFPIPRMTGRRIWIKGKRILCCLRNRGENDNLPMACETYRQSAENLKSYMQRQWSLVGGMAGTFGEME